MACDRNSIETVRENKPRKNRALLFFDDVNRIRAHNEETYNGV